MRSPDLIQLIFMIAPTLIVGLVAYYFFQNFVRNEENRRYYQLRRETGKEMIPYRVQALERLALYLERIDPGRLLMREKPMDQDKAAYTSKLVRVIEQEFEHNLAQQIYVSADCWDAIRATKNATISLIRNAGASEEVDSAEKLREMILTGLLENSSPSQTGLAYIKKEAQEMW